MRTLLNSWIYDIVYVDGDIKVRDHCHITEKYRNSMHRDYNIRFKLNQKIPFILHNVENYDLHLIMHERGKFSFKINIIPNGLGKYVSFNINKKLMCIDSFQFLRSSLDSVV